MEKIAKEVAIAEVDKWLDMKKVSQSKRETYKDHIEILVESVVEGNLILNEDGSWLQKLMFPIEGEMSVTELVFKPRLNRRSVIPHLNGVKASDGDGRIVAYMAALTGKPKNLLNSLDFEDSRISDSIVVFFVG